MIKNIRFTKNGANELVNLRAKLISAGDTLVMHLSFSDPREVKWWVKRIAKANEIGDDT